MDDGPTPERLRHSDECYHQTGRSKSQRRFSMYDDALGKAWMRRRITAVEYSALLRYAYHWASGGLQGGMQSVDLDRVKAYDPASMTGMPKSEAQANHRSIYRIARACLGHRPAFVADATACYDIPIVLTAEALGYRSVAHGRVAVFEILSDAGYRLGRFWKDLDR